MAHTDDERRQAVDHAQAAFDDVLPRPRWRPATWLTVVGGELALAATLAGLLPWWSMIVVTIVVVAAAARGVKADQRRARETGVDAPYVRRRPEGTETSPVWTALWLGLTCGFGIRGGDLWFVGVLAANLLTMVLRSVRRRRLGPSWIPRWPEQDLDARRSVALSDLDALRVQAVLALVSSVRPSVIGDRLPLDDEHLDAAIAELRKLGFVDVVAFDGTETPIRATRRGRHAFRNQLAAIGTPPARP